MLTSREDSCASMRGQSLVALLLGIALIIVMIVAKSKSEEEV